MSNNWIAIYEDCYCAFGSTPDKAAEELFEQGQCDINNIEEIVFYDLTQTEPKYASCKIVICGLAGT